MTVVRGQSKRRKKRKEVVREVGGTEEVRKELKEFARGRGEMPQDQREEESPQG